VLQCVTVYVQHFYLQCVAVWGSVLQCVAVWCSVYQCVAVCCSVLQCGAVRCSVLQCMSDTSVDSQTNPHSVHECVHTREYL